MSNIEAILNICANLTEIVGIHCGVSFIIASALIAFLKLGRISLMYILIGVAITAFGLATPGVLNWLVASHVDLMLVTVMAGIVSLAAVIFGFGLLYLPVHIAKKNEKTQLGWIIGLSAFSLIIPLLWSISVFLAYKPNKNDNETGAIGSR